MSFTAFPIPTQLLEQAPFTATNATTARTLAVRFSDSPIRIEDFGGKPDWNGSTGTDNVGPLLAALASAGYTPGAGESAYPPTILFNVGAYYFASTIAPLNYICRILGSDATGIANNGGTTFIFPINTLGVQFDSGNTTGTTTRTAVNRGCQGSVIQNIALRSLGGTNSAAYGIRMRTKANIIDCAIYGFPGNAIEISATAGSGGNTEGNCNDWLVRNVFVNGSGGVGLNVSGNDANAGNCIGFQTHGLGAGGVGAWGNVGPNGCAILDQSGLGNNYFGMQITGYGDTGVFNSGRNYILISNTASIGGTTTPGTNRFVWYDVGAAGGASAPYPQWVLNNTYGLTQPIMAFGASNRSFFGGMYAEGSGISHLGAPSLAFGGQLGFTDQSQFLSAVLGYDVPPFFNTGVGGYHSYYSGTTGATNNGTFTFAAVGNQNPNGWANGINVFEHRRQIDGDTAWYYGYEGKDLHYRFLNQKYVWTVTTPSTTQTFGRSVGVPYMFVADDMVLEDPSDPTVSRIIGCRSAVPSTGEHAQGEVYFNSAPTSGGFVGWVCTTGGTPGTFKTFGVIS